LARHNHLLCGGLDCFLAFFLTSVNEILDVLEGVIVEAAAESIMGVHQESEAVEVLGHNSQIVAAELMEE